MAWLGLLCLVSALLPATAHRMTFTVEANSTALTAVADAWPHGPIDFAEAEAAHIPIFLETWGTQCL